MLFVTEPQEANPMARTKNGLSSKRGQSAVNLPPKKISESGIRGPIITYEDKDYDIIDAEESISLRFSASDITNAIPYDGEQCVIALSCRRNLKVQKMYIKGSVVYLHDKKLDKFKRYLLSPEGRQLIRDFDSGKPDYNLNDVRLYAPTGQKLLGSPHVRRKGAGIPRGPRMKPYIAKGPHREGPHIKYRSRDTLSIQVKTPREP